MKKCFLFLALLFLLTGCLDKNNNGKFNVEDNYIIVPAQSEKSKATTLDPAFQDLIEGNKEIVEEIPSPEQTPVAPKEQGPRHSIDEILDAWGSPTRVENGNNGNKSYIWQNCNSTGKYKTVCSDDECSTEPETKCCTTRVNTDKEGYIIDHKNIKKVCD